MPRIATDRNRDRVALPALVDANDRVDVGDSLSQDFSLGSFQIGQENDKVSLFAHLGDDLADCREGILHRQIEAERLKLPCRRLERDPDDGYRMSPCLVQEIRLHIGQHVLAVDIGREDGETRLLETGLHRGQRGVEVPSSQSQ